MSKRQGPGTETIRAPVEFGDQVTGDQFIKNDLGQNGEEEDATVPPPRTLAVALLDRATQWIAVYPKATKSAEHTIEAKQHCA